VENAGKLSAVDVNELCTISSLQPAWVYGQATFICLKPLKLFLCKLKSGRDPFNLKVILAIQLLMKSKRLVPLLTSVKVAGLYLLVD
jgi:hypothetical protein